MSLYTNFIVSYFPPSFKLSYEEGSTGFKLYNSFSNILENVYYENRVLRNYKRFSNPVKQVDFLNKINLLQKDYSSSNFGYFMEPMVFADGERLTHIPSFKDFLNRNPESWKYEKEVKVNNWLIWESSGNFYNSIYEDEHLNVDFSGISEFVSQFDNQKSAENRLDFYDNYTMVIKGRDKFYNEIKENLIVFNTEPVQTALRYKKIEEIIYDGFSGDIKIYLTNKNSPNYKKQVLLDKLTSYGKELVNLKISLEEDSGYSFLRFERAIEIVDVFNKDLESAIKTEHIVDSLFLDNGSNPVNIIDFAINYQNYNLYCLSDDSKIYIYDIVLQDMNGPSEEFNSNSFLSFYREINRSGYLEEHDIGAVFVNRRAKVKNYSIKRISPSGVTEWYDSGSWVNSQVKKHLDTEIWRNSDTYSFDFTNHFNEFGEWEFYIEAEFEQFGTQVIATTVFCEYMKVKKVYDFSNDGTFDGIFFNKNKKLCLSSGNNYKVYDQYHSTFSYSPVLEEVVTMSEGGEIELIMPFHVVSRRESSDYFFVTNGEITEEICLKENERHCLLQVEKSKNKDLLFFSKESDREIALTSRVNVIYYIDGEEKQHNDYINAIGNLDFEKIELLFDLEEDLFVYCENNEDLRLKIKAIDIDSLARIK